jgi:hypothetical protein
MNPQISAITVGFNDMDRSSERWASPGLSISGLPARRKARQSRPDARP